MRNFYTFVLVGLFFVGTLSSGEAQSLSLDSFAKSGTPRIVGGDHVRDSREYPWMVALGSVTPEYGDDIFSPFCGASVIADNWVMTAAHCVKDRSNNPVSTDDLYVLTGTIDVADTVAGELIKVKRIVSHPDYDPETLTSDIAILELDGVVTGITPVLLQNGTDQLAGREATTIGWGDTVGYGHPGPVDDPEMLREVEVTIISNGQCNAAFAANGGMDDDIDSTMLCAGTDAGGRDSCGGDSGGPLIVSGYGAWTQVGIVSWGGGSECGEAGLYGVYSRVSQFIPFIDRYTKGGSVWGKVSISVAGHEDLGVKNASVTLSGTTDYTTSTDASGEFAFSLPRSGRWAGDYTLTIEADGLKSYSRSFVLQGQQGESLEVSTKLTASTPAILNADTFDLRIPYILFDTDDGNEAYWADLKFVPEDGRLLFEVTDSGLLE
ncbi:MAG: trypsin-like serine protease [Thermodesulfobacteriota bacterium]|nr:trypsin-like serine protease [Thermodesulfobacteriota bacterium]